MNKDDTARASEVLATAWREQRQCPGFPEGCRPTSREESYAIQDEMARTLGLTVAGWKLGITSPAGMRQFGVDAPVPGRLFQETLFPEGSAIAPMVECAPKVEPEFAVRLGAGLPARSQPYTRAEIEPSVAAIHMAIEIACSRLAGSSVVPLDMIADNGGGYGFVLGGEISDWRSVDFRATPVSLWIDGVLAAPGLEGDGRVDPVDVALWTANELSARGIGLEAGQLISTGSATNPTPMGPGSEVIARFDEFGDVRVRFSD